MQRLSIEVVMKPNQQGLLPANALTQHRQQRQRRRLAIVRMIAKNQTLAGLILNDRAFSRSAEAAIANQCERVPITERRFQLRFNVLNDRAKICLGMFERLRVISRGHGAWLHRFPPNARIQISRIHAKFGTNCDLKERIVLANEFRGMVRTIVACQLDCAGLQVKPDTGLD